MKENPDTKKYILDKGAMNGDSKNFHYIPSLTSMIESFSLKRQTLGTDQGSLLGNFVEFFRITAFLALTYLRRQIRYITAALLKSWWSFTTLRRL